MHKDILDRELKIDDNVFYCYKKSTTVAKKFGKIISLIVEDTYWGKWYGVKVVPIWPNNDKKSWETFRPRTVGITNMLKIDLK